MKLRDYQTRAIAEVFDRWANGARSVCLVAPTGSGKTRMGLGSLTTNPERSGLTKALWLTPRVEIARQTRELLWDGVDVHVDTIQRLLSSGERPQASIIIHDECHHDAADKWSALHRDYQNALHLGLTATPQRSDGRPLGDCYQQMVVAASYSELIEGGWIVPAKMLTPPVEFCLERSVDLAVDPTKAYLKYGEGRHAFAFASGKGPCLRYSDAMRDEGILSEVVFDDTPKDLRRKLVSDLTQLELHVLWSVYTMTEGVDVPAVSCVIIAGNCQHASTYLQKCGRGLRAHPGKKDCIVIDLVGAWARHGSPSEDREYSLDGKGIRRTSPSPLMQCAHCGLVDEPWDGACPRCGLEQPKKPRKMPKIWDLELAEVFDFEATPEHAKLREWHRLLNKCRSGGHSFYFAIKEFSKLFGRPEPRHFAAMSPNELKKLHDSITARHDRQRAAIYKSITGAWPRWEWRV